MKKGIFTILFLSITVFVFSQNNNNKETREREGGIYNYVDTKDAETLLLAKEYTDQAKAEAIAEATRLANVAQANAISRAIALADSAKNEAILQAEQLSGAARQEAIAEATRLANDAIAEAVILANQARDEAIAQATILVNAARAYTDQAKAEAIAEATRLANVVQANAISRAIALADSAENEAILQAEQLSSKAKQEAIAEATQLANDAIAEAVILANQARDEAIAQSTILVNAARAYTDTCFNAIQKLSTSVNVVSSGNVGIGTTDPDAKFEVKTDDGHLARFSYTGDFSNPRLDILGSPNKINLRITDYSKRRVEGEGNDLSFSTSTVNDALMIKETGNVGIGISIPTKKLDVSGDINLTGNLYKNGTLMTFGSTGVWTETDTSIYYNSGNVGIGCDPGSTTFKIYKSSLPSFELSSSVSRIQIGMATCDCCFAANGGRTGDAVIRTLGGTNSTILYIPNNNNDGNSYIGIGDDANAIWFRVYNNKTVRMNGKLYATEIEVKANVWSDYVFNDEYNLKSLKEVEDYIEVNNRLPEVPSEEEVKEKGINLGEMDAILLKKIEELTLYVIDLKKENEELKNLFNQSISK